MKDPNTDRDTERVKDLLSRAAPRHPDTAGRASAVLERARRSRTRRGVLGGAAIALVAAAVVITPSFLSTSPTTNDASPDDPDRTAPTRVQPADSLDPLTADPCPDAPIDIEGADSLDQPASKVSSVRLCPALLPHVQGTEPKEDIVSSWIAPVDALTDGAGDFVHALSEAPAMDPAECAAASVVWDPFALVITSSDGTRTTIGAYAPICYGIEIGGTTVSSGVVTDLFVEALAQQREELAPPGSVDVQCPVKGDEQQSTFHKYTGDPSVSTPLQDDVRAGIVCIQDPADVRGYVNSEGPLSSDQLDLILGDIEENSDGEDGECTDDGVTRVLRLVTDWGDVMSWVDSGCAGGFQYSGSFWDPSDEAEGVIQQALGGIS